MLYVLKFGGSSVATIPRIINVANIIATYVNAGHCVVVVVSAMQGATAHLLEMASNFTDYKDESETDVILSAGEQISAGLVALCLKQKKLPAVSMLGWQVPIYVDGVANDAEISAIDTSAILSLINHGQIPVVAGFQGVLPNNRIATIGRGGSDATAIAIASALSAKCVIYTDVDGVYTADPRIAPYAKRLSYISYDDMFALAGMGAKVLQQKSVKIAKKERINVQILSSFVSDNIGTIVCDTTEYVGHCKIAGFAHNNAHFINKNLQLDKFVNISKIITSKESADTVRVGIVAVVGIDVMDHISNIECITFGKLSSNCWIFITECQKTEQLLNAMHNKIFL